MSKKLHLILVGLVLFAMLLAACAPPAAEAPAAEAPAAEAPAAEAPAAEAPAAEAPAAEVPAVTEAPAAEAPAAEAPAVRKVAVLFPGVVSDQSWNQFGFEGLKQAETGCGAEIAYSENVFQDAQLETFRNYAAEGYNIIIGHGGEYAESLQAVAKEFPDVEFGVTNGLVSGPNVSSIKISYSQMGYLAGSLACEMTKTNHIAFIGAEEIQIVEDAAREYKRAAQECGKGEVQVDVVMTGSWADVNKAYEASRGLIAGGADVLWHVLDTADAGLVAAAQDAGVYAIGLYRDSSDLGPKAVIGSALGAPGSEIYKLACGEALKHEALYLDVNMENGVGIHFTNLTPADVQARVLAIYEKMKSGEIVVQP
jgi:basic membrane protein A and related proteins